MNPPKLTDVVSLSRAIKVRREEYERDVLGRETEPNRVVLCPRGKLDIAVTCGGKRHRIRVVKDGTVRLHAHSPATVRAEMAAAALGADASYCVHALLASKEGREALDNYVNRKRAK